MTRKEFIKLSSLMSLNLYIGTNSCTNASGPSTVYDSYGGWKEKKLLKTGFFHTEHDGERWWLVTPEGNAFLSFGINHYHEDWWFQDYNQETWLKTFNAENFRDENWNKGFRKAAFNDMSRLGFNTIGMHTNAPSLIDIPFQSKTPYLREYKPIVLDHYRNPKPEIYIDIFSESFRKYCEEYAHKTASAYVNDPMLLGYCMADCPIFTDGDLRLYGGTAWIRILRNLGEHAPGKQAYLKTIKKRYKTIDDFNHVYETSFESWNKLLKAKNWRENNPPKSPIEEEDNDAFSLVCVDRYYSVSKEALFKADSNHLFFGDKLNGNTNCLEKVTEIVSKYVDVIYYQNFGTCSNQSALLNNVIPKTKLPFINGDAGFGVSYEMMPNPYGPRASSQKERSEWLLECCKSGFSRPEFIGWHVCGIIDTWKTMPTKKEFQHQGLMSVNGVFYPEMETAVKSISSRMYTLATPF
jgi:hypothetical protein